EAFLFGAVKVSGVQKTVSSFFPDTGNLLSAGFDVLLTKEGNLSVHIFAKTASPETAQMLVTVLNNYKALLVGLLLNVQNSARNGGNGSVSVPDPDTLVHLRQAGETVYMEILLMPGLVPLMQDMFGAASGAGVLQQRGTIEAKENRKE
ncbi:MAG: hypothetical protein J6331_01200, partial [Lentisphaeria bacterium]|nr:hypothetical protein [Lentisphaeria bacterium]